MFTNNICRIFVLIVFCVDDIQNNSTSSFCNHKHNQQPTHWFTDKHCPIWFSARDVGFVYARLIVVELLWWGVALCSHHRCHRWCRRHTCHHNHNHNHHNNQLTLMRFTDANTAHVSRNPVATTQHQPDTTPTTWGDVREHERERERPTSAISLCQPSAAITNICVRTHVCPVVGGRWPVTGDLPHGWLWPPLQRLYPHWRQQPRWRL